MGNQIPVEVTVADGTVTIRLPVELLRGRPGSKRRTRRAFDRSVIEKTRGIWRHRRIDGLDYQRRVRAEWS